MKEKRKQVPPKRAPRPKLSEKHKRFVDEYLVSFNATDAAKRAGYSEKTAYSQGQRLLKHVEVSKALADSAKKRAAKMEITAERVLLELARIAFFDPRKLFDAKGNPVAITELDDDTAAAIAGLEVVEQPTVSVDEGDITPAPTFVKKYKVSDKTAALTNAMKYLGLLRDKVEHTFPEGGIGVTVEFVDTQPEGKESGSSSD